ncbi:MAG: peptidoglycan-binding domain-containing protein [Pseudomonadota bacterium]
MSMLKKGSKGSKVKELQTLLNKAGAKPKLTPDGLFGSGTLTSVKAYQKKKGLKPDGLAGPATLGALSGKATGGKSESGGKSEKEDKKSTSTTIPERAYFQKDWLKERKLLEATYGADMKQTARLERACYKSDDPELLALARKLNALSDELPKLFDAAHGACSQLSKLHASVFAKTFVDPKAALKDIAKADKQHASYAKAMARWEANRRQFHTLDGSAAAGRAYRLEKTHRA